MIASLLLYGSAYLMLLQPKESGIGGLSLYSYERLSFLPLRTSQSISSIFFPVNWLDHQLRPEYWKGTRQIDTSDLGIPIGSQ